jgi:hypothetical protein
MTYLGNNCGGSRNKKQETGANLQPAMINRRRREPLWSLIIVMQGTTAQDIAHAHAHASADITTTTTQHIHHGEYI